MSVPVGSVERGAAGDRTLPERVEGAEEAAAGTRGRLPARLAGLSWPVVGAIVVYLAISALAYWPVEPASASHILGCACGDQVQEVWFLAWIDHAITHGLNPFFTTDLNYPFGVNLADNTSMPLLGLLALPVTLLHGPVAAYNLLMRLGFALSAISMLFVVRRFTRRLLPAFLAGLLYGFSPYMVGEGNGHLFLVFVPLPPLIFLAVYELCRTGTVSRRRWGLWLGVLATAEYFISLEILATTVLCCLLGLIAAGIARPSIARERLLPLLSGLGWSLVVFVPLVAYPLYIFLYGRGHVVGPPQSVAALAPYRGDLLGPIVPTIEQRLAPASLAARGTSYAAGNVGENGAYLGIPLVLAVLALIARYRRVALVGVAAFVGLCCFVLSLGTPLTIDNHSTGVAMPFALLTKVSLFEGLLSARFSLYVQLCAAVVLAIGTDRLLAEIEARRAAHAGEGRRSARWCEALVVVVAAGILVPLIPRVPYPSQPTDVPAYFSSGLDRAIPAGSVVLTYPYDYSPNNYGMLWQATSGFRFQIVGGEATRAGKGRVATSAVYPLAPTELQNLFRVGFLGSATRVPAPPITGLGLERVREFFSRWHIGTVVVDPIGAEPDLVIHYLTVALRRPPLIVGGLDVWYHVSGA